MLGMVYGALFVRNIGTGSASSELSPELDVLVLDGERHEVALSLVVLGSVQKQAVLHLLRLQQQVKPQPANRVSRSNRSLQTEPAG